MRSPKHNFPGREGRKDEPEAERLEVFEGTPEDDGNFVLNDGPVDVKNVKADEARVRKIRGQLAKGADSFSAPITVPAKPFETSSFNVPVGRKEAGKFSLGKFFRKYATLGLIALGVSQGGKLQAEGTNEADRPAANANSTVPTFKAPARAESTSTFIYGEQKIWEPKTPEQKEAVRRAKEALAKERQADEGASGAEASSPSYKTASVENQKPPGRKNKTPGNVSGPAAPETGYYPQAPAQYYPSTPGSFPGIGLRQGEPIYEERFVNPDGSVNVVRHGPPQKHRK